MIVLVLLVVLAVVGGSVLAYRNRPEGSIESGITSFRREMRALAPPPGRRRRADGGTGPLDPGPGGPSDDPGPDDRAPDDPAPGLR